ncbi:MAG: hypothetical protein AAGG07_05825 [Planctomycetota bacterium]
MRLVPKSFSINLPWGIGGVSVDVSEAAEAAAWALCVEYNTRISGSPLARGDRSVREALSSLHQRLIFRLQNGLCTVLGVPATRLLGGRRRGPSAWGVAGLAGFALA